MSVESQSITALEKIMQLNVTGHHVDITIALRKYVVNKLEKIERHFDNVIAIDGLIDKLDRQVKKYKEKLADHHARDTNKRNFG
jgi:putative sigma-54 modulation protein